MQIIKRGLLLGLLLGWIGAAQALTITSSSHPAVYQSFNQDTGSFIEYQRKGAAPSGVTLQSVDGALQMTNVHAGSFGVDPQLEDFDALQYGDVFFDYRLTADVKVNFFFRINGARYGVVFSGPQQLLPGTVKLGEINDVAADGKWHRAHIPLRQWLQRTDPLADALKVDDVVIGNWNNSQWLMAGIGGNGTGAVWSMDNFTLATSGPMQAEFAIKGDDGESLAEPQKYFWSIDNGPRSPIVPSGLSLGVSDGFHLLQISDGDQEIVGEYAFCAAVAGPQVGAISLQNNEIIVPLTSTAGINSSAISIQIDDKKFDFKTAALRWNQDASALILDAANAGLHWEDGAKIAVQLSGINDFAGHSAESVKSTLVLQYEEFTAVPPLPTLASSQKMGTGSFESSLDSWESSGNDGTILQRDTSTAASGYASLRLTCPANAAPFKAWIHTSSFEAADYPYLEFDYRAPAILRVDLLLTVNGRNYAIVFTDRTRNVPRLGKIDGVKTDMQWHHATVPLLQFLQQALPTADSYTITDLAFGDTGWLGNAKGVHYWIDNFHFVPAVDGNGFEPDVQLRDVTGIQALSWTLAKSKNVDVPREAESGKPLTLKGSGLQWLHLRAQDGANNWSPAAAIPLALDAQNPVLSLPGIASGTKAAPTRIQWPLQDNLAVDLSSLKLNALDHAYTIKNSSLTYNVKDGKLTWDLLQALRDGDLSPLEDGQTVSWQISAVSDAAGHQTTPLKSTFVYDYSLQKSLPEISFRSSTHPRLGFEDFEEEKTSWRALRKDAKVAIVKPDDKDKNQVIEVTDVSGNNRFAVRIFSHQWDPQKYHLVSFDYNIPKGSNLALQLHVKGKDVLLKLCGQDIKADAEIPGIITDGKWHTAIFNLMSLPDKLLEGSISAVDLVDPSGKTPPKTKFLFDNVLIQGGSAKTVALQWKALDLSGISGYRFAWDQNPETTPTQGQNDDSVLLTSQPGRWFAHLQAKNGAGLWSEVAHYPVIVP